MSNTQSGSRRSANARVEANDRAIAADYSISIKRKLDLAGADAALRLATALIAHAMHRARQSERRRNRRGR